MFRYSKTGLHGLLRSFCREQLHHIPITPFLTKKSFSLYTKSISTITPYKRTIFNTHKMNLMTISQSLDEAYTKHKVIPDVVDKFDTQGLLTIEYGESKQVALGNTLKVDETQERPQIQFTLNSPGLEKELSISSEDKFALVLTDPDAPSNKDHKWSEYAHWIITDLRLNADSEESAESLSTVLDYSKGKEILPYVGPAPPASTGKHRYVFLLFKQDPSVNYEAPPDRPNWGTGVPGSGFRDWIKKVGGKLELFGINFFYAQNVKQDEE